MDLHRQREGHPRVAELAATDVAEDVLAAGRVGRLALASTALGALLADSGLFPLEAAADAIGMSRDPEIAELNLLALEAGAELVGRPAED